MNTQRQTYFSVSSVGVPIRNTADYSPFGVQLDGRTIQGDFYRFGYQGSEKDDETKGGGNSYTTFFRQLDPRVGRWFSADPVFQPYQSPYSSMDANPILFSDSKGDIIDGDENAKEDYSRTKENAVNLLVGINNSLNNIKIKANEKSNISNWISGRNKEIKSLSKTANDLNEFLNETKILEDSKVTYWLNSTFEDNGVQAGYTGYNKENERVTVNYSNRRKHILAHELKHAFQYETRQLVVSTNDSGCIPFYDRTDEVEAYNRQSTFETGRYGSYTIYSSHLNQGNYSILGNQKTGVDDTDLPERVYKHFFDGGNSTKYRYNGWLDDKLKGEVDKLKDKIMNENFPYF